MIESASRSRTGGILPNASPNEAKTLDEAGPNVIVTSGNCGTLAQESRLQQASRTQTRRGSRRVASLHSLGSNSAHPSPSLPGGPRSHYAFMTDESQKGYSGFLGRRLNQSRQRLQEIGDLGVDISRIGDGPGDFLAKDLAVTTTEAVSGDLDGTLRSFAAFRRSLCRIPPSSSPSSMGRRWANKSDLPAPACLRFQASQDVFEQDHRPAPFKETFGRQIVGRFVDVTSFGVLQVDRDRSSAASSLESAVMIASVGQEVATGGSEKRAEPATSRVGFGQVATLDQIGEKPLNEVAGLVSIEPLTTGKGIERIPVIAAQSLQCVSAFPIGRIAGARTRLQ